MGSLKNTLFKKSALAIFLIISSGFLVFFIFNHEQSSSLRKLEINKTTVNIEIAANQGQKIKGLSGKNYLPANQGILFVEDESKKISIWMKDMRFAIDIVWIDENFKIIHIENNVQPDSFPKIFSSQEPARYVLEVNAGFTTENNIKVGDKIKLQ